MNQRVPSVLVALLLCPCLWLAAQTTIWTGAADHDFANDANWTAGAPATGDEALIPAGTPWAEWTIAANTVMDFELVVADTLYLTLIDAQLAVADWLDNGGLIEVQGTPASTWSLQDTLHNSGHVVVAAPTLLTAGAVAFNEGDWESHGDFQNFGIWLNAGDHIIFSGTQQNAGLWQNDGQTLLATDLHNLGGSIWLNRGLLEIAPAGSLTNYGQFEQQGQLLNEGAVLHSGSSWIDGPGAMTTNRNLWTNQKSMSNQGAWANAPCATFIAEPGSSLLNIGGGTFTNGGILFVIPPGAVVEVTDQNGFISPDLAWGPAPTALCVPDFSLPLGPGDVATLTPDDIDAGSYADYCGIMSRTLSQTTFTCADTGPQTLTLTVTDSLGNEASCTTVVTITDTVPPQITCPADTTFQLGPGVCAMTYTFDVTAGDNCTYTLSQTDGSGLASGSDFPIGMHTLTFTADDGFNQTSCSFTVTVLEHQPATDMLACNDQLNISLGADCTMEVTAELMLEGTDYRCYDNYLVEIEGLPGPWLGADEVGQSFVVTITDPATGNSCWGTIVVEDKQPPTISGCDTLTLSCVHDPAPTTAGGDAAAPDFADCSGVASVLFFDQTTTFDCDTAFAKIIHRTWIVRDNNGYADTCVQVILVEPVSLLNSTITCPDNLTIECDPNATDVSYDPSVTGYPEVIVDGVGYPVRPGEPLCDLAATYDDVVIPLCGAGMKIVRTWKVYDWCQPIGTPDNPWTCTQVIKFMDTTPPVIDLPDTLTVGTTSLACSAQPFLPPATFTDCSDVDVVVQTPVGTLAGNGGQVPAPGLDVGTHVVTYVATDACDNTATRQVVVVVADDDAPVAVCDEFTVVSLNSDGLGELFAESIDDGSVDNCCISHFEIRRMDDNCGLSANTAFGPSVTFCCADLGQSQTVVMRVWDCHGNHNECMVTVEVQDKLPPQLTCPPDLTIDCGGDFLDLELTGRVETDAALVDAHDGFAFDNCSGLEVAFADSGILDCGEGIIARTWTVTDMDGNEVSCIQTLTLENNAPYDGSGIVWPADITVSGCGADIDPATTGTPQVPPSTACRQLMTGMNDVVLGTTGDACLKVLRTWFVIDWCQYDPNDPDGPGIWQHTQVIKVIDDEAPVLSGCTDRTFCNFKDDCSDIGVDLSVVVSDDCTPDSLIDLSWEVDLYGDGTTDDAGNGQNFMEPYPLGSHRITYTATDGCGNSTTCTFYFVIEDCKKPSPVCAGGVAVELMPSGEVSVPAGLLVADASDNCSAADALWFSFSPDPADTVRTFNCDQLGSQQVQVWVTDEAGNQDYCQTIIVVQDNMGACGVPLIAIGGAIGNEEGDMVEDVVVELSGNDLFVQTTDAEGHYMFADMMAGHDYTVTPSLDADPLNGVTTYDIVLLGRHIQQVQLLDSPYKLIAADVDGSGHISVSDMLELRKLILHTIPDFTNNRSWRFVPADYDFPDPANPFAEPFPEVINWNNLDADQMASDFVAVKVGDLNGSAVTNSLMAVEDRTEGWTPLRVRCAAGSHLPKGKIVEISWLLDEAADLAAAQFTFEWDAAALELLDFEPGKMASMANFGLSRAGEGRITASWDALGAAREDAVLARLTFRVLRTLETARAWQLTDALTPARAWRPDGTPLALVLATGDEDPAVTLGSVPNPFGEQTRIFCQLAQNRAARLTLTDLSGRVLWQYAGWLEAGRHEWRLDSRTVPAAGVYLLRLETDGATMVRKLVRTE